MTKTLLVLRHGKSSWQHPALADHDRPLNARGRRDAPRMGRLLRAEGLTPDRIVSSTAVRAHATAELVAEAAGCSAPVLAAPALYLAGPETILDVAASTGGDAGKLLVVGHNPGLEALLTALAGRVVVMPTAALAALRIDVPSWSALTRATPARWVSQWLPRDLPAEP